MSLLTDISINLHKCKTNTELSKVDKIGVNIEFLIEGKAICDWNVITKA